MYRWQTVMAAAQKAYGRGAFSEAMALNRSGLDLARDGFYDGFQSNPKAAIAAVMVSYFSLVDSCREADDLDLGCQLLAECFDFLRSISSSCLLAGEQSLALAGATSKLTLECSHFLRNYRSRLSSEQAAYLAELLVTITPGSEIH